MDLVNHLEGRLLFAVPKKGRLSQPSLDLLSGSDIQFRRSPRLDIALVKNHPIALVFLPAADIPTFVGEGRVDLGITGRDQVEEHDAGLQQLLSSSSSSSFSPSSPSSTSGANSSGVKEILDLGFGKCALQVQVPESGPLQSPQSLIGKTIVTSFTNLTERYFRALESSSSSSNPSSSSPSNPAQQQQQPPLRTKILPLTGSVEAACALGVAHGIVDLVESGETMRAAGLHALDTVCASTAVLITRAAPSNPALVRLIAERIKGVITAGAFVLCQYNVRREGLGRAKEITPGKRAPTVTALLGEGGDGGTGGGDGKGELGGEEWVAVSSMVPKRDVAGVMDRLTEIGATDILVLDIANSRAS